jgi:hypothetical protein
MFAWKDASTPGKVIAVFTAIFLVALGMCGLTAFAPWGTLGMGMVEGLVMLVAIIGIVATLIGAFIGGTFSGSQKPQTLFGDDRERKQ